MKELIKPNGKEVLYSEIEGYCERRGGYYDDYCEVIEGTYACYDRYTTMESSDSNDTILF